MRIISQDGTIDVPYDCFSLSIASGKYEDVVIAYIYCYNLSSPNGTKLAKYSAKEKAIKAMAMLKLANIRYNDFKLNRRDSVMRQYYDKSVKIDSLYGYFQFPQDDEIEV